MPPDDEDRPAVWVDLSEIDTRPASEVRASFDAEMAREYAKKIRKMPPLEVFVDADGTHRLANGYHRYEGWRLRGSTQALCEVRPGTYDDAYRRACEANDDQGIPTRPADKRHRVLMALKKYPDPAKWTQYWIADLCRVSRSYVTKLDNRELVTVTNSVSANGDATPKRRRGRSRKPRGRSAARPNPSPAPTAPAPGQPEEAPEPAASQQPEPPAEPEPTPEPPPELPQREPEPAREEPPRPRPRPLPRAGPPASGPT
jgi:hypothetical protein